MSNALRITSRLKVDQGLDVAWATKDDTNDTETLTLGERYIFLDVSNAPFSLSLPLGASVGQTYTFVVTANAPLPNSATVTIPSGYYLNGVQDDTMVFSTPYTVYSAVYTGILGNEWVGSIGFA